MLVDGFIATATAAAALARAPHIRPAMVFCHRSQEAGHHALLDWLGADPLLDMDMRLGEGTARCWPGRWSRLQAPCCATWPASTAQAYRKAEDARRDRLCAAGRAIPDAAASARARLHARAMGARAALVRLGRAWGWGWSWRACSGPRAALAATAGRASDWPPGLMLTGALHEDGLADCLDGLGGGRDRDHALAIMRDSRIGSYGALGLAVVLGLQARLLASLALPPAWARWSSATHWPRADGACAWAKGATCGQGRGHGADRPLGYAGWALHACGRWAGRAGRVPLAGHGGGLAQALAGAVAAILWRAGRCDGWAATRATPWAGCSAWR